MQEINSLIEEIKKIHLDTVYADRDYNGYYLVVDEFFEKLKPLLESKLIGINAENQKLEWQENPPEKPMTWNEAVKYAESLGEGWRLPTRAELIDAYDNKVQGFEPDGYWSSSTYDQNTNYAWNVDFYIGDVYNCVNKANNYYVRCVRNVK